MRLFPKLDHDDWMFLDTVSAMLIFPAIVGGLIGGCMANSYTNVQHDELREYASSVSNRLDRIEYAINLFSIPVQRKEESK